MNRERIAEIKKMREMATTPDRFWGVCCQRSYETAIDRHWTGPRQSAAWISDHQPFTCSSCGKRWEALEHGARPYTIRGLEHPSWDMVAELESEIERLQAALWEVADYQGMVAIGYSSPLDNELAQNTVYEIVNISHRALGEPELDLEWPERERETREQEERMRDLREAFERAEVLLQKYEEE